MKVWYARVSTNGQSLELQLNKLKAYGCTKIFEEKKSWASRKNRPALNAALDFVREGDELIVTRLDRLARSVLDLSNTTNDLQNRQVGFVVLDQAIDTTTPTGKLLFHVLSAIGEFERELINERVRDGLEKAKANGTKLGRPPKLTTENIDKLLAEFGRSAPKEKIALMQKYGIGKSTLYRYLASQP